MSYTDDFRKSLEKYNKKKSVEPSYSYKNGKLTKNVTADDVSYSDIAPVREDLTSNILPTYRVRNEDTKPNKKKRSALGLLKVRLRMALMCSICLKQLQVHC